MYGIPIGREIYDKLGGWTADSWIMADVAADIPSKIDMRWMSRYGIFLYMAEKFQNTGIRYESYTPLVKAIPSLLENTPKSPVQVDLKWFSKLIQATGLHPAWVPIVTVAENIMAISDEMTLLRTGWLNLFKEGLLNVTKVEEYLSGLLVASYQVGYWDTETKEWKTGWINLPVRWLPHERRLLQLRMAIDRIMDLYREFEKYVSSGVRTLAITAKDAMARLKNAISIIDKHYSALTKAITGQEMHITFDEEYENIRLQLLETAQIIEVRERIRYWWYRLSSWLFYRIAYGYVTRDDAKKVIDALKQVIYVHEDEEEFFLSLTDVISGIVKREYYPTPSQLATLAEYMTIPQEIIEKSFVVRKIPEELRQFWKKYIELRPLVDDFRALFNAYYRAKRYKIAIPQDLEKKIHAYFVEFNVTDKEKELRDIATQLEILIEESREYIPTPSMLGTLAEYMVIPMEYIQKVFEARHVPEEWRPLWLRYIQVKPIKSDYKALLSSAIRALRYGVITEDQWKQYMNRALEYGFTELEVQIIRERAELEVAIAEAREYIPTPSMLATMAEYVTIPVDLINKVFEARRVPKEWQPIWLQYIQVRPLADDARALMYSYVKAKARGVAIPEDIERRIKEFLDKVGITEAEINIRLLAEQIEGMIEYIPTLGTLASMAEYIEVPMDYIKKVLELRRVEKTFAELWLRYIYARMIASEVNAVVNVYRRIYEYFFVPQEVARRIEELMMKGGWTKEELMMFKIELDLRKDYRIMQYMIPTIRQFASDARYIPEWEQLFRDLLKARGIDVQKYQKQIDYYRKLIRNRMVWRQVSWYRSQLVYAYANGVITKEQLRQRLERLKAYGLSDAEIELIMDGAELNRLTTQKIYGPKQ